MRESKSNTERYSVVPTGEFIMVASDLLPSRSATGNLVIYSEGIDEPLLKGTIVAVGPRVGNLKVGDRVMFQNDMRGLTVPIEPRSRDIIGTKGPIKYLMKAMNAIAILYSKVKDTDDPDGVNNVCEGLKPDAAKQRRDDIISGKDKLRVVVPKPVYKPLT